MPHLWSNKNADDMGQFILLVTFLNSLKTNDFRAYIILIKISHLYLTFTLVGHLFEPGLRA